MSVLTFVNDGQLIETNYWQSEYALAGKVMCSVNADRRGIILLAALPLQKTLVRQEASVRKLEAFPEGASAPRARRTRPQRFARRGRWRQRREGSVHHNWTLGEDARSDACLF